MPEKRTGKLLRPLHAVRRHGAILLRPSVAGLVPVHLLLGSRGGVVAVAVRRLLQLRRLLRPCRARAGSSGACCMRFRVGCVAAVFVTAASVAGGRAVHFGRRAAGGGAARCSGGIRGGVAAAGVRPVLSPGPGKSMVESIQIQPQTFSS